MSHGISFLFWSEQVSSRRTLTFLRPFFILHLLVGGIVLINASKKSTVPNNLEYCTDVTYIPRKFLHAYLEINTMQSDCTTILACKLDVETEELTRSLDWLNKKLSPEQSCFIEQIRSKHYYYILSCC